MDYQKLFKNCLSLEKTEVGVRAVRFTNEQLEFYKNQDISKLVRANSTASVKMEFITSKEQISFCYKATAFCRPHINFDIYENDVLMTTISNDDSNLEGKITYSKANENETKISIYLDYSCDVYISDCDFGDFRYVDDAKLKYLALGDSITQGMDSWEPSITYVTKIAQFFDAYVLNQGVGGACYDKDSLDDAMEFKPHFITVAYGTNDLMVFHSTDEIKKRCYAYYNKLISIYKNVPINVILPVWRKDSSLDKELNLKLKTICDHISEVATSYNCNIIDGSSIVPNNEDYFGDKRLHPNGIGFMHYAMGVIKNIKVK